MLYVVCCMLYAFFSWYDFSFVSLNSSQMYYYYYYYYYYYMYFYTTFPYPVHG